MDDAEKPKSLLAAYAARAARASVKTETVAENLRRNVDGVAAAEAVGGEDSAGKRDGEYDVEGAATCWDECA